MHDTMRKEYGPVRDGNTETRIWEDMRRQGLKQTHQRRIILEVFLDMGGHPSTEELHEEISAPGPQPGARHHVPHDENACRNRLCPQARIRGRAQPV